MHVVYTYIAMRISDMKYVCVCVRFLYQFHSHRGKVASRRAFRKRDTRHLLGHETKHKNYIRNSKFINNYL